jgi:hypothetical protein
LNKFTKSVRVFADAQNLFIITKYKGVDPEVSYASQLKAAMRRTQCSGRFFWLKSRFLILNQKINMKKL